MKCDLKAYKGKKAKCNMHNKDNLTYMPYLKIKPIRMITNEK